MSLNIPTGLLKARARARAGVEGHCVWANTDKTTEG